MSAVRGRAPRRVEFRPVRRLRHAWLALASCILLAACGQAADTRQPLDFWTIGREGEAVAKLIPEFEKLHPDIQVRLQQLPLTAAHQKLLTAYAGDSTPDLSQLGNTWIPELVALHALAPLDQRVRQSRTIDPSDYFANIWATNQVGGQLYGIPWYVDTRLLFYRKDLLQAAGFDAPPRDWQEWSRMLAALSTGEGRERRYGILLPTNEFEQLLALALQQDYGPKPGDGLLRDGNRYGNFESAGFKRALSFYVEIFRRHQAPAITNGEASNPWNEFGRGVYAFYLSGPWNIGEFRTRLPAAQQDAWATAPLPGPDGPGASSAGGSSLVIFRRSRHQQAAWQLIEYLSQPAVQQRFYQLLGDMPPRRSSWAGEALRNDAKAQAFRDQLERVRPTPPIPEWERIVNEMQLQAARVIAGEVSVDQATAELDRRVDAMLAKRRWMLDRGGSAVP